MPDSPTKTCAVHAPSSSERSASRSASISACRPSVRSTTPSLPESASRGDLAPPSCSLADTAAGPVGRLRVSGESAAIDAFWIFIDAEMPRRGPPGVGRRGAKIVTGSARPLTEIGSSVLSTSHAHAWSSAPCCVARSTRTGMEYFEAACISLAARLTCDPLSVYSRRSGEPASQQKTLPVVIPIAQPSGATPSPASPPGTWASASAISSDAMTARASSSSCARPGSPKATRKRVPLSSVSTRVRVPPCRQTFSCTMFTAAWQRAMSSISHACRPSPITLRKTDTSFRCSET
mmetsp:Transcript_704/g.2464  ORF Transcript_704/g.2464 Transcript_704/m.2464 type:complete len:292 (+) Transcript_704:365-1240(+)